MKKIKQQKKRGISLIVLVITIIVMIILAAAIILSLDGSDIIERAKNSTSLNDVATAKEIVALAKSEWSFERPEGYDTFREYAESKLEEAGFDMEKTYIEDSGKVLFDTAARFARAGVQIGTEVQGYTLNSTTSYTTSGKENTYDPDDESKETNPQSVTLIRDTAIKWTYIGVDKDGNAMLAGSVTSTTPKISLGGKSGYLNGPSELNKICDAMYSSSKGTARSMNLEDVTRVLEYTGEKSSYDDVDANYIPIQNPRTVGQVAKEMGVVMSSFGSYIVEEGKNLASYQISYFEINKTTDAKEYNTARADLIYPSSGNTKLTQAYWLSSTCVYAYLSIPVVDFRVRSIHETRLIGQAMVASFGQQMYSKCAIRPIVVLDSNIDVSYNGTVATIK